MLQIQPARAALVATLANIAQKRAAAPAFIIVALVQPDGPVQLTRIENTLEAKQALIGALIEPLEIGMKGLAALSNRDAILNALPFNRFNPKNGEFITGPFLILGKDGEEFVSLKREQVDAIAWNFGLIVGRELL